MLMRSTVHQHRNLLAHAPERLHEEISADYNDMIHAKTPKAIETRRKSFIRKWWLKCRAVADSLEEAGDRLFTFTRLPDSQWRSARTTKAIERLHEEFKRRIKTQTMLHEAITSPRRRRRYANFHQLRDTTANATFALNAGVWFRRVRLVMFSPDPRQSSPPSGRKSTNPAVWIPQASSVSLGRDDSDRTRRRKSAADQYLFGRSIKVVAGAGNHRQLTTLMVAC
jgi:hypothetical protein